MQRPPDDVLAEARRIWGAWRTAEQVFDYVLHRWHRPAKALLVLALVLGAAVCVATIQDDEPARIVEVLCWVGLLCYVFAFHALGSVLGHARWWRTLVASYDYPDLERDDRPTEVAADLDVEVTRAVRTLTVGSTTAMGRQQGLFRLLIAGIAVAVVAWLIAALMLLGYLCPGPGGC